MAPEQAQGLQTLDHRADVWSLAAITYESLTGKVPFEGGTGPAILLAILTKEPNPPSSVSKSVPSALDLVMEEALTKDPSIRVPSVGALADRVGSAYGLEGSHGEWAHIPQDALAEQIAKAPPRPKPPPPAAAIAPAQAKFESDDPFKAGSAGGPTATMGPAFNEDLVMGVPKGHPRWLVPAVAGAFVVVGAIVAFLILH
jgi:serine/threonine-protein kinase